MVLRWRALPARKSSAKKRHWPSHSKRFKLQHKEKRKLKSDPSYHLLKVALIKSANDTLRDAFIQSMYTHTHSSHKHRDICNHVLEGKNSPKGFTSTNSEEKPQKVLITPFEGDDEKAQYASFKDIFI